MSTKRSIIFEDGRNGGATATAKRMVSSLTALPRYLVPANDGEGGAPAPAVLAPTAISARKLARFFR